MTETDPTADPTADPATGPDTDVGPLGSAVAPPDDEDSGGAVDEPASGQAGPSYPPAGTEPDAHP